MPKTGHISIAPQQLSMADELAAACCCLAVASAPETVWRLGPRGVTCCHGAFLKFFWESLRRLTMSSYKRCGGNQIPNQRMSDKPTAHMFGILFDTGRQSLLLAPLQDGSFICFCLQHVSYCWFNIFWMFVFASDSIRLVRLVQTFYICPFRNGTPK